MVKLLASGNGHNNNKINNNFNLVNITYLVTPFTRNILFPENSSSLLLKIPALTLVHFADAGRFFGVIWRTVLNEDDSSSKCLSSANSDIISKISLHTIINFWVFLIAFEIVSLFFLSLLFNFFFVFYLILTSLFSTLVVY